MSTSLLCHAQGIRDFHHVRYHFENGCVIEDIERSGFCCPACRSLAVSACAVRTRGVTGQPCGGRRFTARFTVHRIYCRSCRRLSLETIPFLSHPKARITRGLERTVMELRSSMSISAICGYFGLDWDTVKELEKRNLAREYAHIRLKDVHAIGVDGIFAGRALVEEGGFLTIVRDLESGAVLFVGEGRGAGTLAAFGRRLRASGASIDYVTMDMSAPFAKWVPDNLPGATVVHDHFHVIKKMNEALDNVRRRVCAGLDDEERKAVKRRRFLLLHNAGDLDAGEKRRLENIRRTFADLGTAHMMKEGLRAICRQSENGLDAALALRAWCMGADQTSIPEIQGVARCMRSHFEGILAFWTSGRLTNGAMEGFNNKVRCLVRQAYGYHDLEYFKLKIYDLPDLKIQEAQSPRKRTIPKPRQEARGATAALTALALAE